MADTWVDIDQDSTMMGAVKEAIEVAGYTQEGAESGYIPEITVVPRHNRYLGDYA